MGDAASTARRPVDGKPWGEAIHATAVALSGAGLLILGPSGSGKSRLASALIAASRAGDIRLVGDDRILLAWSESALIARPHPRIAGFIERRGLGIVACPYVVAAPVQGIVRLDLAREERDPGPTTLSPELAQNFSTLPTVVICAAQHLGAQCDAVLSWWRDACTTHARKSPPDATRGAEVWNW